MRRALLSLSMSSVVAACGGSGPEQPDPVDARGPDYTFVVSELDVELDNGLGRVIEAVLAFQPPNDIESVLDTRIARGELIVLVNVKADDLVNASGVGFILFAGSNPTPPACLDASDPVCRHHLTGAATFQAAAAEDNVAAGRILAGRYTGSAAALTVRLGEVNGVPIELPLRDARVQLDTMAPTSWGRGTIGGAIAAADLETVLVPWLAAITGVGGESVRGAVQGVPLDHDLDDDGVDDALTVGIGIQGVPAWFTPVR